MRLKRFRVTDFRSVSDSGWIEADNVTALIGVNESGKTNLLLPLWKLKPARDGEIQATSDYPKTKFGEIRSDPDEYAFIQAEFDTEDASSKLAAKAGLSVEKARIVSVTRYFSGEYAVDFPLLEKEKTIKSEIIASEIKRAANSIASGQALKQELGIQEKLSEGLHAIAKNVAEAGYEAAHIDLMNGEIMKLLPAEPAKTSSIVPIVRQLTDVLTGMASDLRRPLPGESEEVLRFVYDMMPSFVYYSNYGNLDSEIYLPHVVDNLKRDDLGSKEAAKARTLRVLFSFVQLQPQEILELGREFKEVNGVQREPTPEEIAGIAEKKRTRSILLQSASATLTDRFRDWWKQGTYRFRFEADGNHFRIWVADDRRPTEVELENRSTGLQWFLSFYLVFLVESRSVNKKAILLLDEPGMSLHPLAQRDLSAFFESLAATNQIIYTSHSPFLVDADRLERARKVYVASDGTTKATANLRHSEGQDEQAGAAYAVHSALNLSVAESLLVGCQPVLVEGASDQHYLTAIKSLLLSDGRIKPKRELVFPPCGGAKTARVVASILTGRDEVLPKVLLDSDVAGKKMASTLRADSYAADPNRVIMLADYVGFDNAEVEDLFPAHFLATEIDRMFRVADDLLSDVLKKDVPFVEQVEAWAKQQKIDLGPHWKVMLAVRVKQKALSKGISAFDKEWIEGWTRLFSALE